MPTITEPKASSAKTAAAKPSAGRLVQVQPYLFFGGRTEEALEFYRRTLSAEVTALMRFKDAPPPEPGSQPPSGCQPLPPGSENRVMHASFRVGTTEILASDGCDETKPSFQGFALSVTVADEAEADRVFASLSEGGQVQMPLMKTFFSPKFGMVADRFGVSWMVYVAPVLSN